MFLLPGRGRLSPCARYGSSRPGRDVEYVVRACIVSAALANRVTPAPCGCIATVNYAASFVEDIPRDTQFRLTPCRRTGCGRALVLVVASRRRTPGRRIGHGSRCQGTTGNGWIIQHAASVPERYHRVRAGEVQRSVRDRHPFQQQRLATTQAVRMCASPVNAADGCAGNGVKDAWAIPDRNVLPQ